MRGLPHEATCYGSGVQLHGLVVLALLLVWPGQAAWAQSTVLVGDPAFQTNGDPIEETPAVLTDPFTTALDDATDCDVLSTNDIREMARFEEMRQLLGAGDAAFAEELAGALGADTLVVWQVGKVDDTFVINARAFENGSSVAAASSRTSSRTGLVGAAQEVGAAIGQKLECRKPDVDYVVYEVTAEMTETTSDPTQSLTMTGRVTRTDTIEIPVGLFASPTGRVRVDQIETSAIIRQEILSQCPSPGGYRDLPSKVDQFTETRTTASARTEPSVDIEYEGTWVHIKGSVSGFVPRTVTDIQRSTGISCGRALEPTTHTNTTGNRSMALEGANFDMRLPRDGSTSVSQPFELNGWTGTATLTWKPRQTR